MAGDVRRCDGTCDTCGQNCSTGTIDEYIAQRIAQDPAWAADFAEAQRELDEWLAQCERSGGDGG